MSKRHEHGVMDASYGKKRRESVVLRYRYQSRALVAIDAVRQRRAAQTSYNVLDLGAADAHTLLHMRSLLGCVGQFHGVELAPELIALAPELPANVELYAGDVTRLPGKIAADHYDLCTALAVLEHLADPAACIREAYRVLRPGGVYVATCPSPFWDRIAGRLGLIEEEAHEHEIDGRGLAAEFRRAGFEDVSFEPFMWVGIGALPYLNVPVSPRFGLTVDRWLRRARVLERGFVNQAVVARKPISY